LAFPTARRKVESMSSQYEKTCCTEKPINFQNTKARINKIMYRCCCLFRIGFCREYKAVKRDEVEQLSPSQMVQIMKVHSDSSSVVQLVQERIYVLMIHIGAMENQKYIYLVRSKVVKQKCLCISNDCICIQVCNRRHSKIEDGQLCFEKSIFTLFTQCLSSSSAL
jgi:hypothetical protein